MFFRVLARGKEFGGEEVILESVCEATGRGVFEAKTIQK
jgi:hypothetical protein